ncbi:MAG: PKD domain-containing protein [Candidatus Thermoplasmatota archaeon]|jgi:hypothetical protein|nr:PKD domain-containing protein [Candidatus Thermoplasmatota archaeon]
MSYATGARTVGIFLVLSLVLAGLFIVPAGASVEGMANLKVLVKNQKEENIEAAKVSCENVHTGKVTALLWNSELRWFEADVAPGTYQVFAMSEGFTSPADPQMVIKLTQDSDDVPAIIITLTKVSQSGMARVHVTYEGTPVEDASVHLFGDGGAHLKGSTTPKGFANISCPLDELHLLVFSKDMLTYSTIVDINGTEDIEVALTAEPAVDEGSYRVLGRVMNGTTLISGISVNIWDGVNGHLVPHDTMEEGSLSLPLYPSVFHLLIEANGFESYWLPDIDLRVGENYFRPTNRVFEMSKIKTPASKVTVLDLTGESGISSPHLTTVWTLDANSKVYGSYNDFGNPRMQVAGYFYSNSWLDVSASEELMIENTLAGFGPVWMDTKEFLLLNGKSYIADLSAYTVGVTGLAGDPLESSNPVVDISVSYDGDIEYKANDDLRIEVLSVLEDETVEIVLPTNYEILGDFGTKADFPSGNTSRLVVKEPLEFNAKVKKAPEAKLTFKDSNKFYRVEPKKFIVKVNENITLTGKDSKDPVGKIMEYNWDLPASITLLAGSKVGDKEASEQITFQFTVHSDSYYNITLFVKDSSGLRSPLDWINLMPDSKAPTIDTYTLYNTEKKTYLEAPYGIDEDVLLEFNASTADDEGVIADHVWSFSDGSGTLNGDIVKHRFADPGTYNISLLIRDTAGNELKLVNRTISVRDTTKPLPVFVITPTDVKIGAKVKLNASQSYDPRTTGKLYNALVNYTWQMYKVGSNYTTQVTIGTGKVLEYTFSQPGNWVVNLTVADGTQLKGWYEKTIFVGGPDLQIEAITFVKPEQTKLREGDKAKISIRIKNNGLVDTPKNTTWYVKITMNGKTIKNESIDIVVAKGKTIYTNITYELKNKGSKEFEVYLDPTNAVQESEETNNKLKTQATIKEAKPWFEWWYALILVAVILVVYVVFMRVSKSQWGYEPIVELWKKYMG